MKITQITVKFGARIPTQQWGSVSLDESWTVEVGPDEKAEDVSTEVYQRIRAQVHAAVKPMVDLQMKQIEGILRNLPKDEREKIMGTLGVAIAERILGPIEVAFAKPPAQAPKETEKPAKGTKNAD